MKKFRVFSGARKRPHLRGSCAHEVRDGKHRFPSAGRAKTRKPPASAPRRASTQAPSSLRTLLQRDEGQRGMGRRAPPPADGRATGDGSPMRKPCQCDGVAIAIAASCQCCRSQLGIGTEDRQHWHTGNTPRPAYRQHFKNREIFSTALSVAIFTEATTAFCKMRW